MAITLRNAGVINGPGAPFRIYKLILTLDGTATSASLQHGLPEVPLYYQLGLGGTSTTYVSKCVANSTSATSAIDVTISGAGTDTHTLFLHAYIWNQGT